MAKKTLQQILAERDATKAESAADKPADPPPVDDDRDQPNDPPPDNGGEAVAVAVLEKTAVKKAKRFKRRLYAVSLPGQPRAVYEATDEADAVAKYDAHNGILSTDHQHHVEEVVPEEE
jgi:hypothetical protein